VSAPFVFVVPMPPNLANGRMHHMVKHREKLAYWRALDCLLVSRRVPRPPKRPWPRATVSSAMVLGNAMDDGNAMNRHKWLEDWLVSRGYLADDSRKHLTWAGLPAQRVSRTEPPTITLTITPEAA
jgi:hypothetical protein